MGRVGVDNPLETLSLPRSVGSRELKTRLGSYLRLVREGASFVVTDRGRPVAELRPLPMDEHALGDKLYELAAAGVIGQEISERQPLQPFEPIPLKISGSTEDTSLATAVSEGREDRF